MLVFEGAFNELYLSGKKILRLTCSFEGFILLGQEIFIGRLKIGVMA